ncbi:MAG: site-2 protease family protein [Clostridia bacterium]|nr:site-2 protease family protein [Clostridia bacterium]
MPTFVSVLLAVLAFGFLVAAHEFGHFIVAKLSGVQVNEFAIGMGPKLFSFGKGETRYSLRLFPIGGFCAMEGEDAESENPRAFTRAKAWKRFLILIAGSAMNLVVGFLILVFLLAPSEYTTEPVISSLADEYGETGLAGIEAGDRILKINGERVYLTRDIAVLLDRYAGSPYEIVLKRNGEKITLRDTILEKKDLHFDGEEFHGYGIRYQPVRSSFFVNARDAVYSGIDYVRLVRFSLADLFSGRAGVRDMSGPVGITSVMTEVVSSADYLSFFNLVAFISINLAVMNLLPLPALDGGRVLFLLVGLLVKLFTKKTIPYKWEGYVHLAGLGLFIILIVYVTVNDIIRLVS